MAVFAPLARAVRRRRDRLQRAASRHSSSEHLLGTDELGRDVLSRLIWGARASMQAGFFATVLAMVIAVPIGLVAGYYRGWVDTVDRARHRRAARVPVHHPRGRARGDPRPVAARTRRSRSGVGGGARADPDRPRRDVRAPRGGLRAGGRSRTARATSTIIFRHILPNMTSTLIVQATRDRSPARSSARRCCRSSGSASSRRRRRGARCCRTRSRTSPRRRGSPSIPGLAIVLAALAFNVLGDGLRDILDPRTTR